jgi:hypothetical protein
MRPLGLRAIRSNMQGKDVLQANDMPRARVWNSVGEAGHGPGAANIGFDKIEYDTDNMAFQAVALGSTALVCRSSGLYMASANTEYSGGGGAGGFLTRIIINNTPSVFVAESTDFRDPVGWGINYTICGPWLANKGDYITLYASTTVASNINGGRYNLWLAACMISSTP